ncbi:hypothetical protein HN859_02040 [Candidatus Parcubacteria bacterium]|nr:hypothetical protein [Candidatus Parcubacteria bacterium]
MKRRFFALTLLPLGILMGCQKLLAPQQEVETTTNKSNPQDFIASGSVAAFLDSKFDFDTDYQSYFYPDWLLLTFLGSWGEAPYKYFIDGQYMTSPINLTLFNPRLQKLTITLEDDTFIWGHKPRRYGTHLRPKEELVGGPR